MRSEISALRNRIQNAISDSNTGKISLSAQEIELIKTIVHQPDQLSFLVRYLSPCCLRALIIEVGDLRETLIQALLDNTESFNSVIRHLSYFEEIPQFIALLRNTLRSNKEKLKAFFLETSQFGHFINLFNHLPEFEGKYIEFIINNDFSRILTEVSYEFAEFMKRLTTENRRKLLGRLLKDHDLLQQIFIHEQNLIDYINKVNDYSILNYYINHPDLLINLQTDIKGYKNLVYRFPTRGKEIIDIVLGKIQTELLKPASQYYTINSRLVELNKIADKLPMFVDTFADFIVENPSLIGHMGFNNYEHKDLSGGSLHQAIILLSIRKNKENAFSQSKPFSCFARLDRQKKISILEFSFNKACFFRQNINEIIEIVTSNQEYFSFKSRLMNKLSQDDALFKYVLRSEDFSLLCKSADETVVSMINKIFSTPLFFQAYMSNTRPSPTERFDALKVILAEEGKLSECPMLRLPNVYAVGDVLKIRHCSRLFARGRQDSESLLYRVPVDILAKISSNLISGKGLSAQQAESLAINKIEHLTEHMTQRP